MDLVEVTQSVELFFIPSCYNAKTMSFLDCPDCGFSVSAESYEYIRTCQADAGDDIEATLSDIDGKKSVSCLKCRSKLALHYRYCPTCGAQCRDRPVEPNKAISFNESAKSIRDAFWDHCDTTVCGYGELGTGAVATEEIAVTVIDEDWDFIDGRDTTSIKEGQEGEESRSLPAI